ncbi:MAG: hypothetical protein ACE5R4_18830, partial [Armatimonadota bacterium]
LHKEVGGADHLSVAWAGPGIERQVISGGHLAPPEMDRALVVRIGETARKEAQERRDMERSAAYWKSGRTLPLKWSKRYPLPPQSLPNDTGINILLDHAHQVAFAMLWGLSGKLRGDGFRVCGSQATLDTVLTPGSRCRVRLTIGNTFPFGWWRTPEFNVVITYQGDPNAQSYLPEERKALREFVERGGGLIIIPSPPRSEEVAEAWSLNALASDFGAFVTAGRAATASGQAAVLRLSEEWEVTARGEKGEPVRAQRRYGKGRVVLLEGRAAIADGEDAAELRRELVAWAASGKEPVGGPARIPTEMAGGGGIYPELEQHLGGIVLYYSRNQTEQLLKVFTEDLVEIKDKVYEWLPSPPAEQPMYVIASSGGGGGWACNYLPKENGIISLSPVGIVGVFAHELAHTMCGPVNEKGVPAARSPHGVQGEAHAGWFQGKAYAYYDETRRDQPCRGARERQRGEKAWSSYSQWWWLWQKMDDRYGATWFPRWYWVRATRWQEEPGHVETWDEMVEDMCIAVGEDLFPFMNEIGAPVTRERLERIEFRGKLLELAVADIDTGPAGPVVLDAPGDYTQPLR